MLIICNVSAQGKMSGYSSKMHNQVKGLGYLLKQEVNDWNLWRREGGPSNATGDQ